jgi:APA family basic amino acid/polyamine antiporter
MSARLFVRQSSGLVRSISAVDAFVGNLLIINLVITATQIVLMPWLFPGLNLPLSVLITAPLVLFPGTVYLLYGLAMPRSGGDYVYISRTLHPALGFAANCSVVLWNMSWMGAYANWVTTQGIAASLSITGTLFGNTALTQLADRLATPWSTLLIGTAVNVLLAAVLVSGLRRALLVQRTLFLVAFLSLALGVLVVALASHAEFLAHAQRFFDPAALQQSAQQAGLELPASWNDLRQTLYATGLNALALLFMWFVQYAGGEIQNVRRTLPRAVLGSLAAGTAMITLMAWAAAKTFGPDFLAAFNHVFANAPDAYPFTVPPSWQLLQSLLTDNPVLVWLMALAFIAWPMAAIIMNHLANSRCMFAWAFDRLLPEKLAEVNERTGSPVVAILLSAIGAELFLIVFTFWGNTATFFGGSTLGYLLAFGTTALAGLLWPLLRPDSFRRSPAAVQLFGLPLIQIAGAGTLLYFAFLFWAFLTNPAFGLARLGLVGFALYWLVGLGIFVIAWQVRRAQGIDLSLVYREVPAE